MDPSPKYDLLQRIAGVRIIVFRGRETRSGQPVLLHQLTESNDHTAILTRAIQYLVKNPASAGGRILDLVEIQQAYFLVTVDQPECLALREWLDWDLDGTKPVTSSAMPAPATTHPPPSTHPLSPTQPGEFTQLFQNPQPASQTGATPAGPGEFTKLFSPTGQRQPMEAPRAITPSPQMAPPQVVAENQPGEFTRLFRNPLAPSSEASREPLPIGSPSQKTPGEFTRIFGGAAPIGGGSPAAAGTPLAAPPRTEQFPTPVAAPGSLTESVEPRQTLSPAPGIVPATPAGPGEFTRVIGPARATPPASPASMPPASAPAPMAMPTIPAAPAVAPAAPVHLTMAAPTPPPAVSFPASAPAPGSPGPAEPPFRTIVILFAILLLAAFALILFVILRK